MNDFIDYKCAVNSITNGRGDRMKIEVGHGESGPFTLLDGATSGLSAVLGVASTRGVSLILTGNGSVSAGSVLVETSADPDFGGQWAPYGAPITIVPGNTLVSWTGLLAWVRCRVVSPIVGGTLTITATCSF